MTTPPRLPPITNQENVDWLKCLEANQPAHFKAACFGADKHYVESIEKMSLGFLKTEMKNTRVAIHVADKVPNSPTCLSFSPEKNFRYDYMTFTKFLDLLPSENEIYYFRSLGVKPAKDPASLEALSTNISNVFRLPELLSLENANVQVHSRIIRVSPENLELWTHYDMPDNFLVSIRGTKRVVLFPPDQVANLYIETSSSPVMNVAQCKANITQWPRVAQAMRTAMYVDMEPGDILFLPAMWLHSVLTLPGSPCISCNVFFCQDRLKDLYALKDIYGNKDFPVVERARASWIKDGNREAFEATLRNLPHPFCDFYLTKYM